MLEAGSNQAKVAELTKVRMRTVTNRRKKSLLDKKGVAVPQFWERRLN
jgi:hypothetical protein